MTPAVVICLGPTGVGYFAEVTDMPSADRGVFAAHHGAFLVCDAAIVAYICAEQLHAGVHLVTNHLGSVEYESQLIQSKLGAVTIHPDHSPFTGAPLDMIFVDRERGTRSYVTTNYFPSKTHLVASTRDLLKSLPSEQPTVLYADIEAGSESGSAVLQASTVLATSGPSVWNVGQVTQLADVDQWLEGIALPEYATIQVSLGDSSVTAAELRSTYRRVSSAAHQKLVVTLGSNGAAWADADTTEVIAADSVPSAFTLGAGAVFASSLVLALVSDGSPSFGKMVSNAVVEASGYVRDASLNRNLRGLGHW